MDRFDNVSMHLLFPQFKCLQCLGLNEFSVTAFIAKLINKFYGRGNSLNGNVKTSLCVLEHVVPVRVDRPVMPQTRMWRKCVVWRVGLYKNRASEK